MKKLICIVCALLGMVSAQAKSYDNPDTLFVSRDGTCEFRNVADAIEVCRAFMEYHKVSLLRKALTRRNSLSLSGLPTSRYVVRTATRPLSHGTIMPISVLTSPR